jgi:tryptophan-rich sensory protein
MKNWIKLLISITVPVAVGAISGFFTRPEIKTWYHTIKKPDWQPPDWLFGPVWTTLYIMMGIAFYIVWKNRAEPKKKRIAITLWIVQLVLNFFWSFVFFKQHQIDWAFGEIVLLWVFILLTIFSFARISKAAAWLLVPYISWVTFAGILTYTIYHLNT